MTSQRKRKQELNMLIAKREDYMRFLRIEMSLTQGELFNLKSEYDSLEEEINNVNNNVI